MTLLDAIKDSIYSFRVALLISGWVWLCSGFVLLACVNVWPDDVVILCLFGFVHCIIGGIKIFVAQSVYSKLE